MDNPQLFSSSRRVVNVRVIQSQIHKSPRLLTRKPQLITTDNRMYKSSHQGCYSPLQNYRSNRDAFPDSRLVYSPVAYIPLHRYQNPEDEEFAKRSQDKKLPKEHSSRKSLSRESQHSRSTLHLIAQNKKLKEQLQNLKAQNSTYCQTMSRLIQENQALKKALQENNTHNTELDNVKTENLYNKELIQHFQGMITTLNRIIQTKNLNSGTDCQELERHRQLSNSHYSKFLIETEINRSLNIYTDMLKRREVLFQTSRQNTKDYNRIAEKNRRLKYENRLLGLKLDQCLGRELELSPDKD